MKVIIIAGETFLDRPIVTVDLPVVPQIGDTVTTQCSADDNECNEDFQEFCNKEEGLEFVVESRAITPEGDVYCFVKCVN